ncbi:MAG TPA: hypothetical protein VMY06_11600 [Sedimentisphaerales bacterium]|nr:hypothetical protein [Sedimentisphaerales bacterium]
MDNFDNSDFSSNANLDQPIPLDEDLDQPIPFDDDDDASDSSVSHSPLSLEGGGTAQAPKIETPKIDVPKPALKKVEEKVVSTNRITGVRTFFTKLHPGALDFLDEQITKWLKENPGVTIRRTNTVTGMIQAKKTEPNIIISIWY